MNENEILSFRFDETDETKIANMFYPYRTTREECEAAWAQINREFGSNFLGSGDTSQTIRFMFVEKVNSRARQSLLMFRSKIHKMPSPKAGKVAFQKIADAAARLEHLLKTTNPHLISALHPLPILHYLDETISKAKAAADLETVTWKTSSQNLPRTELAFWILDLFERETGLAVTSSKSGKAAKALAAIMNPILEKFPKVARLTVRLEGETKWECDAAEELIKKYLAAIAGRKATSH